MSEWQPIETAPRDGTAVLVYLDGWQRAYTARWTFEFGANASWEFSPPGDEYCAPTHWHPLPEPPTA